MSIKKKLTTKYPHFLHGGDYNPDQWLDNPEILREDLRLMKLANTNTFSLGIFSWATLEPEEGKFDFEWLDKILDSLASNGSNAIIATPTGSRPAWMSKKYPEVLGMINPSSKPVHMERHNHCRTSPIYREKTRIINTKLAERYKDHPALIMWHISNEYNGTPCHCPLCYNAFYQWLENRYGSLEEVNKAWWSTFWSHTYTDWDQISPKNTSIHGLVLDWQRFSTDQTINFYKEEIVPFRKVTPNIPITSNFMGFDPTLDYWKFAKEVDVISWDSYPTFLDKDSDWKIAAKFSLLHSMNRSFKQQPFLLMECAPGSPQWQKVSKLKRPGVFAVETMQAIAHGSDSILYFQWRKGRGGHEKFHAAVVDHEGSEKTRAFKEVTEVGDILSKLDKIVATDTKADVAILYDWENRWALENASGPRKEGRDYAETCMSHYYAFWQNGVACDVISEDSDISKYKLVIAPMAYMIRDKFAKNVDAFVKNGGSFVTTYLSGIVGESDLCFTGGFPGPLKKIMGIWAEEIDALYDGETVIVSAKENNDLGLKENYSASIFCDVIHAEGAEILATYGSEFYKDTPAVTVNDYGKGKAYYIASRNNDEFHFDFYEGLINKIGLKRVLENKLPLGVTAQVRTDGDNEFIFLLGFNKEARTVNLGSNKFKDLLSNELISGNIILEKNSFKILEKQN